MFDSNVFAQLVYAKVVYLLNDAVFDVDICFLGEVVIDHLPSLDEDPHRPHVGSNSPTRGKIQTFIFSITLQW